MKKRISIIDTPSVNKAAFQPLGDLPSRETANDLVSQVTGQQAQPLSATTEPKGNGRPVKEKAIGRVKFTTAIRGDVIKWVKHYAIEADETPADVLENALLFYMDYKKSLKG